MERPQFPALRCRLQHSTLHPAEAPGPEHRNIPPTLCQFYLKHKTTLSPVSKYQNSLHKTHLPQLRPSQFVRGEAEMYFVVIVTSCLPYWFSLCRGDKLADASYSCVWRHQDIHLFSCFPSSPRHPLVLLSSPLCFPPSPRHACLLCVFYTLTSASSYNTMNLVLVKVLVFVSAKFDPRECVKSSIDLMVC